jgi:hypothetical protein
VNSGSKVWDVRKSGVRALASLHQKRYSFHSSRVFSRPHLTRTGLTRRIVAQGVRHRVERQAYPQDIVAISLDPSLLSEYSSCNAGLFLQPIPEAARAPI